MVQVDGDVWAVGGVGGYDLVVNVSVVVIPFENDFYFAYSVFPVLIIGR